MATRTIGFTARGTKGGNVTIAFDDGHEVSISPGGNADDASTVAADAYWTSHPEGEVSAKGTITISAEM